MGQVGLQPDQDVAQQWPQILPQAFRQPAEQIARPRSDGLHIGWKMMWKCLWTMQSVYGACQCIGYLQQPYDE